jgi:putative redox protein
MSEDKSASPIGLLMDISYEEGTHFLAENSAGSRIAIGGDNPNPIDYLIASLGGCTGATIVKGLSEKGVKPDSFTVKIEGSRRKTPPTVFEKIHVAFTLSGDLDDRMVHPGDDDAQLPDCSDTGTSGGYDLGASPHTDAEINLIMNRG